MYTTNLFFSHVIYIYIYVVKIVSYPNSKHHYQIMNSQFIGCLLLDDRGSKKCRQPFILGSNYHYLASQKKKKKNYHYLVCYYKYHFFSLPKKTVSRICLDFRLTSFSTIYNSKN